MGHTAMGFDLRQQHVDERHVVGAVRFRQHDEIQPIAGAFDHLDEIAVCERRVEAVDAEGAQLAPEIELAQRADHIRAARGLLVDGDGILEIDAHGIGSARRRFLDHRRPRRRHVQHAALDALHRPDL